MDESILRAAAVTHIQYGAIEALSRQGIPFGSAEGLLLRTVQQLCQRYLKDITQAVSGCYEVIAAIQVAVALQDRHATADLAKDAQGVLQSESRPCSLFKDLDLDTPDISVHPYIENRTQKISPIAGCHGPIADTVPLKTFHQWEKS